MCIRDRYLKKHRVTKSDNTVTVLVPEKPTKAGIDPINKLIDRHPEDNTKTVSEGVDSKTTS